MSNRIDDDTTCTRCGGVIIERNPNMKMCSQCQKAVNLSAADRIKYRKQRTGSVKRIKMKIGMFKGINRRTVKDLRNN
jgi:Zn finger protein HypA/HybF involved in hydrogenase expression